MAINVLTLPTTVPSTTVLPPVPINTVASTGYNFQPADGNTYVRFTNGGAITANLLANTFPIGMQLRAEMSSGTLTVSPGVGVTFQPAGSVVFSSQFQVHSFMQVATNLWTVF